MDQKLSQSDLIRDELKRGGYTSRFIRSWEASSGWSQSLVQSLEAWDKVRFWKQFPTLLFQLIVLISFVTLLGSLFFFGNGFTSLTLLVSISSLALLLLSLKVLGTKKRLLDHWQCEVCCSWQFMHCLEPFLKHTYPDGGRDAGDLFGVLRELQQLSDEKLREMTDMMLVHRATLTLASESTRSVFKKSDVKWWYYANCDDHNLTRDKFKWLYDSCKRFGLVEKTQQSFFDRARNQLRNHTEPQEKQSA